MTRCDLVIPVYNERDNLRELHRRIVEVFAPLPIHCSIILVDDGSDDGTAEIVEELADADARVQFVSLTRNFGHQVALMAGLDHATGDCVITMDGDLQHPPELIPELLRLWGEGFKVVSTVRMDAGAASRFKRWTARAFYGMVNAMGDVRVEPGSADFRLLDQEVVRTLRRFPEKAKFLRGLVPWMGFATASIPYQAERRYAGAPRYSLFKMVRFAGDGITAFSSVPLRLAFYLGVLVSLASFAYAVYAVSARLRGGMTIPGWTSLVISVLFLGGVQLMFIGVLGEYVARIFDEVKNRPLYLVRKARLGRALEAPTQAGVVDR